MKEESTASSSSGEGVCLDLNVIKRHREDVTVERDSSPQFGRSYERWSPTEEGATLIWRDLSISAKNREKHGPAYKSIISGVTGAIKPGSLVALMGSSGAGKSTLMAALAYRTSGDVSIEGDILINGRSIGNYMKHLSGFMHQEDLFVGSLTVWEHMNFMAKMKLDRRTTALERKDKILAILKELGLLHRLNTKIGTVGGDKVLSGGEKKRLSFATELLTDPQILFCDEPTTGLDAYSAQKIVSMMNHLAMKGKTVICTIHQPSSQVFAMFSQIILLADGKIAYMGSTAGAIDFFDNLGFKCPMNYNPADFFMRTLSLTPGHEETSKQAIRKICNHFSVSDFSKEVDVLVQYEFHMGTAIEHTNYQIRTNFKGIFFWTKFVWLTHRYFLDILRNPSIQILRMLQKMTIALMVGLCYMGTDPLTQNGIQSLQGALVTIVCENTFPAMYSVLAEFPSNLPLFIREYKSGMYSPGTFYLAKLTAIFPGLILEPIMFIIIMYWLSGFRSSGYSFGMSALTAALIMNVSSSCGVFFSNAFDSVNMAMLCLIPFDYMLMITSGFFVKLSSLANYISWAKYLSWLMYGMESLTIIQWDGVHNITCENPDPDLPCLHDGAEVLDRYSFTSGHLERDLLSMLFLCAAFYTLGFICLLRKIHRK